MQQQNAMREEQDDIKERETYRRRGFSDGRAGRNFSHVDHETSFSLSYAEGFEEGEIERVLQAAEVRLKREKSAYRQCGYIDGLVGIQDYTCSSNQKYWSEYVEGYALGSVMRLMTQRKRIDEAVSESLH